MARELFAGLKTELRHAEVSELSLKCERRTGRRGGSIGISGSGRGSASWLLCGAGGGCHSDAVAAEVIGFVVSSPFRKVRKWMWHRRAEPEIVMSVTHVESRLRNPQLPIKFFYHSACRSSRRRTICIGLRRPEVLDG